MEGIDPEFARLLRFVPHKDEVILLCIQRLIVRAQRTGVLDAAPPLLTRVFQEMSNGVVAIHGTRKIHHYLFPFPYAQFITLSLVAYTIFTPLICAIFVTNTVDVSLLSCTTTLCLWFDVNCRGL